MPRNITIKLLRPPWYNPYSDTIHAEFDLFAGTSVEEVRSLLEIDDLDNIQTEFATGLTLPDTPRNRYYLCGKLNGSPAGGTTVGIIVANDYREMEYTSLAVRSHIKSTGEIEVDLIAPINKWSEKLRELKLCNVDLGLAFPLEAKLPITGAWHGEDDEDPIFRMLAYYQNVTKTKWALWELRPWLSLLYTLKQIFCSIGYTFRSPVFESEYMRHLWWYGLSPEFYMYPGKGWYNGEAQALAKYNYGDGIVLVFDNEITDPDNLWQATNVLYNNTSPFDKVIEVEINFNADVVGGADAFSIQWELDGVSIYETTFLTPTDVQDFLTVTLPRFSQLQLRTKCANPASVFAKNPEGYIKWKAAEKGVTPGDNPQMNQLVGCERLAKDIIKIANGLADGKMWVDEINKVFWIFHEQTSDVFTSLQVQGFYRKGKDDVDIRGLKVADSEVQQNPEITAGKVTLKFQDFDDPYLEQVEQGVTLLPVHGRTFVIDENLAEEKEIEVPLVLPTLNKYSYNPADIDAPFNAGFNLDLPMLLDNADGELSFDLGIRLVYLEPIGIEYFNGGTFYGNPAQKGYYLDYLGTLFLTLFQLGSQFSHAQYDDNPLGTAPTYVPGKRLVFGNWAGNFDSLYSEFYRSRIENYFKGIGTNSIEVLRDVCLLLKSDFFRRRLYVDVFDVESIHVPTNLRITHGEPTAILEMRPLTDGEAICNCFKACDCIWKECEYYLDQSDRQLFGDPDDWTVSSFKVNGNEQLLSAQGINTGTDWDYHLTSGIVYIENFVDTFNRIAQAQGLDIEFRYSDRILAGSGSEVNRAKFMWVKYAECITWDITVQLFGFNNFRITDSQVYEWTTIPPSWIAPTDFGYFDTPPEFPENCTKGIW